MTVGESLPKMIYIFWDNVHRTSTSRKIVGRPTKKLMRRSDRRHRPQRTKEDSLGGLHPFSIILGLFLLQTLTSENKYHRRMLGISYREHKTNEYVRQQVDILAGHQDLLLPTVKRRNLSWFGHVCRHDTLLNIIIQ